MGPAIRPIQQGVSRAGNAVTVLVTPGDNWMFHVAVEQCRAGDILVVAELAVRRWLLRRSTGDVSNRAAWSGWWAISAFVIRKRCGKWDSPSGPVRFMPGTVKESLGSVNVPVICAGQLVQPGDVVVADDDGVVVLPHARVRDVLHKAEARMSNELAKRERMRNGELGLDIYAMRPRLAEKGLRYYDRADEVEE